jgi:membrane protease YdiL (CAAX protease family)
MSVASSPPENAQTRTRARRIPIPIPIFRRAWDGLVHPIIRLPIEIPWDLKQFAKLYVMAAVWYVVGSFVPLILMFGGAMIAIKLSPETMVEILIGDNGAPNVQFMLAATVLSFLGGFGAELVYFNAQLKKEGLSLWKIMHFNLASLNGSWWQVGKMSTAALVIGLLGQDLIEHLPHLPKPHQVTADMAAGLHGGGLIVFGVLAALLAPFFEEIVFRGFLFNSLRKVFREGKIFKLVGESPRFADYCAVSLSACMFAMAHMDPTAFLQLFLIGVLLAELYRRSGTLVCPMLLHALNNIVATMLIVNR